MLFALAGLPSLPRLLADANSYTERPFTAPFHPVSSDESGDVLRMGESLAEALRGSLRVPVLVVRPISSAGLRSPR